MLKTSDFMSENRKYIFFLDYPWGDDDIVHYIDPHRIRSPPRSLPLMRMSSSKSMYSFDDVYYRGLCDHPKISNGGH